MFGTNELEYEYDLSFLNRGKFPTERISVKNKEYTFREKQFNGHYGDGRYLTALINKVERDIPYKVISLNYYKLLTNKIIDLIFNNEVSIKTGSRETDSKLNKIVYSTNWIGSIRSAIKAATVYGDAYVKTYKYGASVAKPMYGFKIINKSNIYDAKAYVLWEPIKSSKKTDSIEYIRFEIHFKGEVFEIVYRYSGTDTTYGILGGSILNSIEYKYNNRIIKEGGVWYKSKVEDSFMVQCMSVNKNMGVYGVSSYEDIQDIVTALEYRISMEQAALNSLVDPLLIVGMSSIIEDESGEYRLRTVNGNWLVTEDRNNDKSIVPQSFQQDFKLDNSNKFIEQMKSELYEISELGRVYLSSEYSGNISEESISNLIKGAIDKANRILLDVYYEVVNSLYVLAVENDIQLQLDDITVDFNIGQTDSDKNIAEVCSILNSSGILSKATLREKYFGYTKEQSNEEDKIIELESGIGGGEYNEVV